MHILICGAGLSGLTAAWFMKRRGHKVTIVDHAPGPGLGTSFANGGLLTPSMSEPWNAPGCWRTLLTSLGREDAALQLRARALPGLIGWGTRFLWHSTPARHAAGTAANLQLSLASLQILEEIAAEANIDFAHLTPGSLRLFRDTAAFARAACAARESESGLSANALTIDEAVKLEPGLAPIAENIVGAIYYPIDEIGDAHRFCNGLAAALKVRGVEFLWNCRMTALEQRGQNVSAAILNSGRVVADAYLVATASHAPHLLRTAGVSLPVRPAKGYSLTVPLKGAAPISIPLVDDDLHAAIVPIGGVLRVAGTAEFAGDDTSLIAGRVDNLVGLLRRLLPAATLDISAATPWCGLRAMSVDGIPLVGRTRVCNLYVNTGHGHLGWTMAAGAGSLAADLIDGRTPAIDPAPYAPARFDRRHG